MSYRFLNDHGIINRYRAYLPVSDATPLISLNEGSTPLIHSPKLSAKIGRGAQIFIKYEGLNPTGSFKDRGMTLAISKAVEEGAQTVICASTGNTSAAAAAYAARAGIRCIVLIPSGKIALGKLAQALIYGAKVVPIDGNFDAALQLVREIGETEPIAIVNSINPYRIEGQKTAAFEIIDDLGDAPHIHILPVGNAANTGAYWHGYSEFHALGKSRRLPQMLGIEAAGAAPIFYDKPIANPDTVASAIRIGNPASWQLAKIAMSESRGGIQIASDDEILDAQQWLAAHEGIFVEPASAASVAGLLKLANGDYADLAHLAIPDDAIIVCTVTGNGLKDPDIVQSRCEGASLTAISAEKSAVLDAISR